MSATKQDFNTLDDAVGTDDYPLSSWLMTQLARNCNRMLSDGLAPFMVQAFENADNNDLDSLHALRINAPSGAWVYIVPRLRGKVAPGTRQLRIRLRLKIDNAKTAYVFAVTNRQPYPRGLDTSTTGVQTFTDAVAGAADDYGPFTVNVEPDELGLADFALVAQTSGLAVDFYGDITGQGERYIDDSTATFSTIDSEAVARDDYWAWGFHVLDFKASRREGGAWQWDNGAASWTELTAIDSATTGAVFGSGPEISDAVYFGLPVPFYGLRIVIGTQGDHTSATVVAEYSTGGAAYSTLTTVQMDIADWLEATGTYFVIWNPPTDWATTNNSGNTRTGFFVRLRLTAADNTGYTTSAAIGASVLRMAWGPERVRDGLATDDAGNTASRLSLVRGVPELTLSERTVYGAYLVGRSDKAWVHGIHVEPVSPPGIT